MRKIYSLTNFVIDIDKRFFRIQHTVFLQLRRVCENKTVRIKKSFTIAQEIHDLIYIRYNKHSACVKTVKCNKRFLIL